MLLIGLSIVVIAVLGLEYSNDTEKVMNDFCSLEFKQNIRGKYNFCC